MRQAIHLHKTDNIAEDLDRNSFMSYVRQNAGLTRMLFVDQILSVTSCLVMGGTNFHADATGSCVTLSIGGDHPLQVIYVKETTAEITAMINKLYTRSNLL